MPDNQPIRTPPTAQVVESPPRRQARSGRSLRHGDLRCRRRPDQAPGGAGALQPLAHQGAAGEICVDRRGSGGGNRRELARPPLRHAEKLRRQRRRGVRHRPDRRGGMEAARRENVLCPGRSDQARAVREDPRRAGRGRKDPWHAGQRHLLSRRRRPVLRHRGRAARQGEADRSGRGQERQASVLAPRGDREAVRPQPGLRRAS